ncbi:hypothetical protein D6D29_06879 [Aureobasidium pullulans]|nr:hypothetical protein D6D29_06879 [Aureobasidium pullulans]
MVKIEVVNLDDDSDDSEGQVAPPHAGIEVITLADDSDEGEPTSPRTPHPSLAPRSEPLADTAYTSGHSRWQLAKFAEPPRRQRPVPAQRAIFGEESPSRSPSPRRVALAVSRTGSAMSGILHNGSRSSSVVSGSRRGSVMSDVDYHGIFPGSSLFYIGTTPSPTRDEHQHVELVDEDVLGPDDPIPTPPRPSPTAMPGVIWTVKIHNIFKISLVVRREALSITLLVEGCTDLKNIVHFYTVRVTEFSTRGGGGGAIRSA